MIQIPIQEEVGGVVGGSEGDRLRKKTALRAGLVHPAELIVERVEEAR
jgi:hypothetical protein